MVHQMYPDWNSHMEMERSQESNKQGRYKGQDARTENMCLNTENLTPNIKP